MGSTASPSRAFGRIGLYATSAVEEMVLMLPDKSAVLILILLLYHCIVFYFLTYVEPVGM